LWGWNFRRLVKFVNYFIVKQRNINNVRKTFYTIYSITKRNYIQFLATGIIDSIWLVWNLHSDSRIIASVELIIPRFTIVCWTCEIIVCWFVSHIWHRYRVLYILLIPVKILLRIVKRNEILLLCVVFKKLINKFESQRSRGSRCSLIASSDTEMLLRFLQRLNRFYRIVPLFMIFKKITNYKYIKYLMTYFFTINKFKILKTIFFIYLLYTHRIGILNVAKFLLLLFICYIENF